MQSPDADPPANPYAPPTTELAPQTGAQPGGYGYGDGTFTITQCWEDAKVATFQNFGLWLGASIVLFVLTVLSTVTVIGAFLLLPVLLWGGIYFWLRVLRGTAEFGDIFAGFSRYGRALGPMLLLIVITYAIALVGQGLQIAGQMSQSAPLLVIGVVVNLVFTFVVNVRFMFGAFFVVDRDMGAVDALRASWQVTGKQYGKIVLLLLCVYPLGLLGVLALGVGVIVTMAIFWFMMASAYRQITGDEGALAR